MILLLHSVAAMSAPCLGFGASLTVNQAPKMKNDYKKVNNGMNDYLSQINFIMTDDKVQLQSVLNSTTVGWRHGDEASKTMSYKVESQFSVLKNPVAYYDDNGNLKAF
jgi:hypothetical protein